MDVRPHEIQEETRPRSSSISSTGSSTIQLRVLAAGTGVCYPISLHPNELTVANLRRHLAGAVPPQDQILLLGPPYKVPKDSTLRSEEVLSSLRLGDEEDNLTFASNKSSPIPFGCALSTPERSGAKRLFLFSKQALSLSAPDPPPCQLEPLSLKLPTVPDPSPVTFSSSPSSPLHQALEVYERRFMLHLCRGRAYADGADMRVSACRSCVAEQSVMARALRAAVSNLADHRNSAARTRTEITSDFQGKTARHASLLDRFGIIIKSLEQEALHPGLVSVAKSSGRMMETLLDTVPVEREKAWANQCRTAHDRLMGLFGEIDAAFSQLGNQEQREEEARLDREAEEEVQNLSTEIERTAVTIRDRQAERVNRLINDHGEVVRVVMSAISGSSPKTADSNENTQTSTNTNAQTAFTVLEEMSKASNHVLPEMETDDKRLVDLMVKTANTKTGAMKRMRVRLRQVSEAQSNIQRVLSSLTVLRDALAHQCENMIHLEHVEQLQLSYKDFLSEIRRRRAYGNAVTSSCSVMMERLASMRNDEVKAREKFLRGSGRHLMPPFYEIFAPTLATPPPLFTPQLPAMVEMDTLPDIGVGMRDGDVDAGSQGTGGGSSESSSLMEAQMQSQQHTNKHDAATQAQQSIDPQQEQSLIVSADTSNELMETCHDERIATEADLKTLAYENAMLRQALERMGGKPPKSYIDLPKEKDERKKLASKGTNTIQKDEMEDSDNNTITSLRTKIADLERELSTLATKTTDETNRESRAQQELSSPEDKSSPKQPAKKCDKISHSSFKVGDVGLFMPTGRGSGGKRTYLAFHSSCPHRYLSTDSIEGTPDYVLGRIVYQEELVAGALGSESNPFGLHVGTKFWVLTVEVIKVP